MTTLFGIKNCDTVKKARQWLDQKGINYRFHDFRVDGIDEAMVQRWLAATSLEKLVNKRSTTWKALGDTCKNNLNTDNAIALCVKHETLIKRPVLEYCNKVYLGFNEKTYADIFNS